MEERLTEVEIKLAHLEQALSEMSDGMYRQQQLIEKLEQTCEVLRQRIESSDGGTGASQDSVEKPPHY